MKEILNNEELTKYLNVSDRTVYHWRKCRGLPHFIIGKSIRYRKSEVDEWLDRYSMGGEK